MKIKQAVAVGLLAMTPALTGCLSHTRSVQKMRLPDVVLNATLDQLLNQVDERYYALQGMTASVQISASTGGSLQGQIKDSMNFSGYIIMAKPENIHVILLLPVFRSKALDMISDGKSFKMLIPPKSCAIVGSDVVTNNSQKGLYSLRPAVILDSLMVRGFSPDDMITMTQDSRPVENPKKKKDWIEEPEYDIEFLSAPVNQVARTLRVLHISRVNMLPYRQDIYNQEGKVVTQAFYENYQKFDDGKIDFPTKIVIQRPLDELGLTITITKATFNQKLDADQFDLGQQVPANYALQNMDDPVSAKTAPCVAHATQLPR
ncbi:MAG: hypothetical protein P4K80_06650 [Acidobacteriaceae bacterium]|nr:hypothetical protein [Acidobacteriaceae bacterium]